MNKIEVYTYIQEIIKELTDVDNVIMADPDAASPTTAYCSVFISNTVNNIASPIITDTYIAADEKISINYSSLVKNEIVLNFYGKNSLDNANKIYNSSYMENVKSKSYQKDIYIDSIGSIINLTSLQSSNFEERAKISIFVKYKVIANEIINSIEKFELDIKNKTRE